MQRVASVPSSCRIGLQPKSGLTGAQVRERARQRPSQSLCLRQDLPASRVVCRQVCSRGDVVWDHRPPPPSHARCSGEGGAGSGAAVIGAGVAGGVDRGVSRGVTSTVPGMMAAEVWVGGWGGVFGWPAGSDRVQAARLARRRERRSLRIGHACWGGASGPHPAVMRKRCCVSVGHRMGAPSGGDIGQSFGR